MPSLQEELKDLESKLQHTLRKLESIQKALDESTIIAITDHKGKITYVLKVDRLKIDRSFIKNLPQSADDQAIVAAVITMAHQLSIDVVAEGIENEKQIQILKEMGCNGGQGYFWGNLCRKRRLDRCCNAMSEQFKMAI